ncbi:hypothetical protein ERD78_02910 [Allopusillimonas soli]|uniref:TIGR04141 family sporadically distributed protein n=1 Tax=Allopusillimonas soli TaxID=659016 RepID=A0A853F755_9BURK|nr:TIGR04141 family sporadically distributed protein [Allopusillimonas soli]NYT35807.1 TIGR04141 family sporadically distributed protein [Allopusillimonas soli]TEA76182.1 hypothetical protein ERD78_02910 [Allopusillimonas soli]
MADKKPYRYLNALLAKTEFSKQNFRDFLTPGADIDTLEVLPEHDLEGIIYIKKPQERRPRWTSLIDAIAGKPNIRRVKDNNTIQNLDALLLNAVKTKDPSLVITIPEIIQWDRVLGFSFTRSKKELSPTLDSEKYLDKIDIASISIESIKKDRLYVTDVDENTFNHSIYTCLYLELDSAETKRVLFGGNWYEIDKSFMKGIDASLTTIQLSDLDFPGVRSWEENNKTKIESEGDYNERAALHLNCHLLDRKLVKCSTTTSPIELCDLLTANKQLIHVKHRKGGSAGLSHLFAQGAVASEVLIGDKDFRKEARKVLRDKVHQDAPKLVPLNAIKSSEYEVIFLILGDKKNQVKNNLPFFSKVNLVRTHDNLTQKGFRIRVAGAERIAWVKP